MRASWCHILDEAPPLHFGYLNVHDGLVELMHDLLFDLVCLDVCRQAYLLDCASVSVQQLECAMLEWGTVLLN